MTTTARTVSDIAAIIRWLDPDNKVAPNRLANPLAEFLYVSKFIDHDAVVKAYQFITRTNPDKTLTPERLAELLVAEFELDKEN